MEISTEGINESVIDAKETDNLKVEVLEFSELQGAKHPSVAQELYYAREVGLRMRRVKFTLNESSIAIEPGLLHYMRGNLEIASGTQEKGIRGFGRALWRGLTAKESVFKTTISGTGEVYLEPTFGYFLLQELDDEAVVADQGIYVASSSEVKVESERVAKFTAMLFGGEGWFQTKVSGTGIVVLDSPVPTTEIVRIDLEDEKLSVDGNFALLRVGDLEFSVEKSSKSWIGTLTSGEGLLQTFEGTGTVWLAPTNSYYQGIEEQRIRGLAAQQAIVADVGRIGSALTSVKSKVAKIAQEEDEPEEEIPEEDEG